MSSVDVIKFIYKFGEEDAYVTKYFLLYNNIILYSIKYQVNEDVLVRP